MEDLKSWYREGLTARIQALEAARSGLCEALPESVESVRRIAHSLRGSGATYGFPEISRAATMLEEAPESRLLRDLDALLAILRQVTSGAETAKLGILVVDDDPDISRLLRVKLAGPGREIFVAGSAAVAEEVLAQESVALVLLDLVLPDIDGRDFLVRLRERPGTATLPVIVLTSKSGVQPKTECLALGADGFFEKPFDPGIVAAAVSARLQRAAEITRELRQDTLTGLPNRAAFSESFERAQSLSSRAKEPFSVAMMDLDRFKSVNDLFGHAMGDEFLRRAATVISRSLRKSDMLARWGGDELVAFFPNTDAPGAARALSKALAALRAEPCVTADGRALEVSFSGGAADVPEGSSVEQALAEADRLLYLAKGAGGSRVLSPADDLTLPKRKVLLAEDDDVIAFLVRGRLEREGFEVLHFADGAAALSAAKGTPISLVILDVKMPGMDGFDVLKRLRDTPGLAHVPVVMLTAADAEPDVVRGLELGADDYIVKPFSPAELAARVRRLLNKR